MREAHRTIIVLLVVGACLSVAQVGCGGSGGGAGFDIDGRPISSAPPSRFAGHWSGARADQETGEQGALAAAIRPDGTLTVTIANRSNGANGAGAGSVSRTGAWQVRYRYAFGPELTDRGFVTIRTDGHLLGQFQTLEGRDHRGSGTFDLVRQP